MRYHYTPTGTTKIKKKKQQQYQMLVRMQRDSISHTLLVGMQNGAAMLEISLKVC